MSSLAGEKCDAFDTNTSLVVRAVDLCQCSQTVPSGFSLGWSVLVNNGDEDNSDIVSKAYWWLLGLLAGLVVITNISVLVGVWRDSMLWRHMHNLLVCGQALCDLSVGLLVSLFAFGTIAGNGAGETYTLLGAQAGCNLYGFGIVATCHSTLFSVSLIAYARKACLLDGTPLTQRRCLLMYVLGVWMLPLCLGLYYSGVSSARLVCSGSFCNPVWSLPVILMCAAFIGAPIVYTCWVYYVIRKYVDHTARRVAEACNGSVATAQEVHAQNKLSRLMSQMSISIILLWSPLYFFFVLIILQALWPNAAVWRNTTLWHISERSLGVAAVASSLVSPVIYAFKNKALKLAMLYAFLPQEWKRAKEVEKERNAERKARKREERFTKKLQKRDSKWASYILGGVEHKHSCMRWFFHLSRRAGNGTAECMTELELPQPDHRSHSQLKQDTINTTYNSDEEVYKPDGAAQPQQSTGDSDVVVGIESEHAQYITFNECVNVSPQRAPKNTIQSGPCCHNQLDLI